MSRRRAAAGALLALLAAPGAAPAAGTPATAASPASGFEGRVAEGGQVRPGAVVFAYATFADLLAARPAAASAPTADDGSYRLEVPPGSWFVVAKRRAAGPGDGPLAVGDGYAYQGSNPVTVDPGAFVHVGFALARKLEETAWREGPDPATGAIEGVVEAEGRPLEGAVVRIFLDADELFRGQGYATSPPTGKSGAFRFDLLPESPFYLVARKRARGAGSGPIAEGDFFAYFVENPVPVRAGKVARLRVEAIGKASEIGRDDSLFRATGTRISGRILDPSGKPVPGVYAFVYEEKEMGHKRPAFISREADAEGRYVISLSRGGRFYVGARSAYGDSPGIGEWYGRYDATADHSVRLESGQRLEGIDVVVEKILP